MFDLKASNYTKWRTSFTAMLGKFGFLCQIDDTASNPTNAASTQQNFTVLTWIYSSITDDILDIIMELEKNPKYANIATIIGMAMPFPSFVHAHSILS